MPIFLRYCIIVIRFNKGSENVAKKYYRKFRRLKRTGEKSDFVVKMKALFYKTNIRVIVGIVLLAILCITIYILNVFHKYDSYKVLDSIKLDTAENSQYVSFEDFIIKYNEDGISYIDGEETVWNDAFEMKMPMVDVCNSYLAIADKNTNDILVYNKKGRQSKITTSYPIVKIEVAKQGVVAALLEDDNANYIEVFDKEGNQLVTHKALLEDQGYPLNFSLSEDGTKMMVSYLSIDGAVLKNVVRFYNFSSAGKNSKDRMVGEFDEYEETIVPTVEFISNTDAIAVGENVVSVYSMNDKPDLKKTIKVEDEIQKVFYNEEYVGLVFKNNNSNAQYRIEVYKLSGRRVMKADVSMYFDTIKFSGKNVLLYNDLNCKMVSFKGIEKFNYTFKGQIKDIIPIDGKKEFLLMSGTAIEKIKLK